MGRADDLLKPVAKPENTVDELTELLTTVFESEQEEALTQDMEKPMLETLEEVGLIEFTGSPTGKFKWVVRGGKKLKKAIRRIPNSIRNKLKKSAKLAAKKRKGKKLPASVIRKIKRSLDKRKKMNIK